MFKKISFFFLFFFLVAFLFLLSFFQEKSFADDTFFSTDSDLYFDIDSFSIFPQYPVVNKKTRIYITLKNTSSREDMRGILKSYDTVEKKQIEVDQSFSVIKNNEVHLFFDFTPSSKGVHEILFTIIPWEEYIDNKVISDKWTSKIFIDSDLDSDGVGDQVDSFPEDSSKSDPIIATPIPESLEKSIPDDVFSLEKSRSPVVILSQMNPFSIRRGEDFIINSGPSRGFLGENLTTKWEIINNKNIIIFTKETPELTFSLSWVGEYRIRATLTNESGISAVKEISFSVRFSWRDFFMATGIFGLSISTFWFFWQRRRERRSMETKI